MGCYSREFTLEALAERHYRARISSYLVEQLVDMSCNDLSRVLRALDALENGDANTNHPGDFGQGGILAGYGHIHYRREDWAAGNLAAQHRLSQAQSADSIIDQVEQKIWNKGGDVIGVVQTTVESFAERVATRATGDWIVYRSGIHGREYLAAHPHTRRNTPEEHALKQLLDSLSL